MNKTEELQILLTVDPGNKDYQKKMAWNLAMKIERLILNDLIPCIRVGTKNDIPTAPRIKRLKRLHQDLLAQSCRLC